MLYDEQTLQIFVEELSGVILGDVEALEEAAAETRDPALDETLQLSAPTGLLARAKG